MASTGSGPTLTSLPAELILDVAKHLRQKDLCSLARTCRYVSSSAQRILFARPHLGHYAKSGSFRVAFADDGGAKPSQLTGVAFDQWSPEWMIWFDQLGPLPNLVDVGFGDTDGVPIKAALSCIQADSRIPRLTISNPSRDYEGYGILARKVESLRSLILLDVRLPYTRPFSSHVGQDFPNVEHIEVHLDNLYVFEDDEHESTNIFHDGGLRFLNSFPRLTTLRLDGCFAGLGGRPLRDLLPRLRHVSFCMQSPSMADDASLDDEPDHDLSNTVLDPCPALQSVYVGYRYGGSGRASAAIPRVFLRALAEGKFASLQRLKMVFVTVCPCGCHAFGSRHWLRLYGSENTARASVDCLRSSGFQVHHCAEGIYAEKPSPSRCASLLSYYRQDVLADVGL